MCTIEQVPLDVLSKHIFCYLEPEFLYVCLFVCKKWRNVLFNLKKNHLTKKKYATSISMLEWMKNKGMKFSITDYYYYQVLAAKKGSILLLDYATKLTGSKNDRVCYYAAKYGHLSILKWAKMKKYPLSFNVFSGACRGGHIRIVEYLHTRVCSMVLLRHSLIVYKKGHIHILKYFLDNGLLVHPYITLLLILETLVMIICIIVLATMVIKK